MSPIASGERIIEYTGELIDWVEAMRRHPHNPNDPHHTFYFQIDERRVIDAMHGGNSARWINHSCHPNCEAVQVGDRVFIHALRSIRVGTEINYDYGLVIEEPLTPELKLEFACRCGSRNCRGTMLAQAVRVRKPRRQTQTQAQRRKPTSPASRRA